MRVAIVTGAARGLGEAIARRLHGDGYAVAVVDLDLDGVERVAGELGERVYALRHDVRSLDSWPRRWRHSSPSCSRTRPASPPAPPSTSTAAC